MAPMDKKDCNFERDENHQFQVGEKVYVIEKGGIDIFEAEIVKVGQKLFSVHFPEYPEDDGKVGLSRLLQQTARNKEIFEKQEEIRKRRAEEEDEAEPEANNEEEEEEEAAGESDDEEVVETVEEEEKSEKTKKKAAKPKEPKAPRKPREPKERKPREPKPKKPSAAAIRKALTGVLREAKQNNIKTLERFESWIDEKYAEDELVTNNRDQLIERFNSTHKKPGKTVRVRVEPNHREYSDSGNYSSDDESEEIRYDHPEVIRIPPSSAPSEIDGAGIKFPGCLSFETDRDDETSMDMIIKFEEGYANCFIYRTQNEQYLILNGMKFKLKQEERMLDDRDLFEEHDVEQIDNAKTMSILYPAMRMKDTLQITYSSEYNDYLALVEKEKKRGRTVNRSDTIIAEETEKKSQKKKPVKKLDLGDIEDTD